jgi:hypothetical protein
MFIHIILYFYIDQIYFSTYQIMIYNQGLNCGFLIFLHFFSCDTLMFIKNYDQNSSNIKIHVILFVKMSGYVWSLMCVCVYIYIYTHII